jgi:ribonuclease-3
VVVKEEGPDHEKHFTVNVIVDDNVIGTGSGKNKKEAEQAAAESGMTYLATNPKWKRQRDKPPTDAS